MTYRLFSFAMALFWVFVQQTCLCCAKWASDDLCDCGSPEERRNGLRRFALLQGILLAALTGLAAADLWVLPPVHPHGNNSPSLVWQFLCTVMLILDGGLVSFEWRICRLHASGGRDSGTAGRRFVAIWTLGLLILYALWFGGAVSVTRRYGLNALEWEFLCLFYFRIVNGLYLVLEGSMGVIALLLWRNLLREGECCRAA